MTLLLKALWLTQFFWI